RPVTLFARGRQHLLRQLAVAVEQRQGVGQDRGGFAQQRIRALLFQLLALGVFGDVAFAGLEAVVAGIGGEGIQRQAQRLAFGLACLALGFELVALGAAGG